MSFELLLGGWGNQDPYKILVDWLGRGRVSGVCCFPQLGFAGLHVPFDRYCL